MTMRMKNPALVLPDAMKGVQNLFKAIAQGDVPQSVLELVSLRASQINGCGVCAQAHVENARKAGETEDRLATVAAWRDAPYFSDAERAALALTESVTRIADRTGEAVPDEVWNEAARHYDERQLSAILLTIATTNFFNRLNVTVKEQAGSPSWV